MFPKTIEETKVPPIKIQGIKTKLVPFILKNVSWHGKGRWIEPFVGSGVVLFNALPDKALVADTNQHIIGVYQAIQSGFLTPYALKDHLEREGKSLETRGETHYYEIRDRFNAEGNPFDFIFLNRASFNGLMRFNGKGHFNVPFCRKPERFRQAYITKICNQVQWAAQAMQGRDWEFVTQEWQKTLASANNQDFVYMDPPYIGRHTDYFNGWKDQDANALADTAKSLPCPFAYSMWKQNQYRKNQHLADHFADHPMETFQHFYHVGSTESLRNPMEEALIFNK